MIMQKASRGIECVSVLCCLIWLHQIGGWFSAVEGRIGIGEGESLGPIHFIYAATCTC